MKRTSRSGASGATCTGPSISTENPVDFLLTAKRDLEAAKRFFRKALKDQPLLSPGRIGADGAGSYPPAIAAARKAGLLARTPVHYVTKHLQQGIESDHFRVKRPMPRVGCFQAFHTARRTIQGFEAMLWLPAPTTAPRRADTPPCRAGAGP